jgi:antitoxin component of RelBE/YafQ-DinJ toxin-antitoxin module
MQYVRYEIKLDPKTKADFLKKAESLGMSPSLVLRMLIMDWIDGYEYKRKASK